MRKLIILGAAVAALGLAACGDTETVTTTETTTTEAPTTTVTTTIEETVGWSQAERDEVYDYLVSPPDALSSSLARCAVRKMEDQFPVQDDMFIQRKRERERVAGGIVAECFAEGSS